MSRNLKSLPCSFSGKDTLKNYARLMRLDRPVGIFLCLWPALWSLSLSSSSVPSLQLWLAFIGGAILMRSIGCIVNDLIDQNIDRHVRRTKDRPLASGQLSRAQAFFILGILSLCTLSLLLTLNQETIQLGLLIVIPVVLYPVLKRFTYWPQIFLGLVFNWGVLMADMAQNRSLSLPILILYVACVFWTIGYDTLYAFQDYEDDKKIDVKSSALKIGYERGKGFIFICYGGFFIGLLICAYLTHTLLFGLCLPLWALWVLIRLKSLSLKDPRGCGSFFKFNALLGFLIWASILLTTLVQ